MGFLLLFWVLRAIVGFLVIDEGGGSRALCLGSEEVSKLQACMLFVQAAPQTLTPYPQASKTLNL